jgi:gas vesicle structural protein
MSTLTQTPTAAGQSSRGNLIYDVLELILDRGLVIDVFVRVSLVGIELVTIDARVVVASVDTYLRFAESANRLDLTGSSRPVGLPDLVGEIAEEGAEGKVKGVLSGIGETISDGFKDLVGIDD